MGLPKNTRWREVPDRRQAIEQTIAMMRQGDLLLLAGKGHEDYQIVQNKTIPFDEREIVTEILKKREDPMEKLSLREIAAQLGCPSLRRRSPV